MAQYTSQGANFLRGYQKANYLSVGKSKGLPDAYLKFLKEWKVTTPAAVHYIPKEGRYQRNIRTGIVTPVQNRPIPLKRVPEEDVGMWGGEAIIKGFQKRHPTKRRVPHFWVPTLKRSVVRSEILNEFFSMTVTDRTIRLILSNNGFDHYLLKTMACDLYSLLALKMKQRMLTSLLNGCPEWEHDPKRQEEIKKEFNKYLDDYTPEEIEWYGLTWEEAIEKTNKIQALNNPIVPHKIIFRERLLEQLREAGISEAQETTGESLSWMKKINPFSKKET
ncbi:CLUMA_CG013813, isoform A [Clunio marinus]|uniref:Large ribosomal subunit protein bL28m n=1 Tax=Clunio marinus TaxID=568069 RepID=A0A1J1IPX5_9DIPT|nr:CLUMA_CG013813, isoform A [Clunio marinus]